MGDKNQIECVEFSQETFCAQVLLASKAVAWGTQTIYLASYLSRLGAKTLIIEHRYVDRHFMEEFGLYYSRCLRPPQNYCVRIHALSESLDTSRLKSLIATAARGQHKAVTDSLQQSYLGFVVIRPLPIVPIGRTVVAVLKDDPDRQFTATTNYDVHFLGFGLSIHGLAFQQQDRGVAACATTAVWAALQRLVRHDGGRAPTPPEITEAAAKNMIPLGRALPSEGLTMDQVCEALRSFSFPPVLFTPCGNEAAFRLELGVYLRSGIPVVLALSGGDEGHAVTAVGFRRDERNPVVQVRDGIRVRMFNLDYEEIYIHDDRLGPYANAFIERGSTSLTLRIDWPPPNPPEHIPIFVAAAPLYPKLRTDASKMIELAGSFLPFAAELADGRDDLGVEVYFDRAGTYTLGLMGLPVDADRIHEMLFHANLSRYIGIARWYIGNTLLCDTVWDTTDTVRDPARANHLIAAVAFDQSIRSIFDQMCGRLGIVSG